jgi:hypothetical protein
MNDHTVLLFGFTWRRLEPTIYRIRSQHANHYTTRCGCQWMNFYLRTQWSTSDIETRNSFWLKFHRNTKPTYHFPGFPLRKRYCWGYCLSLVMDVRQVVHHPMWLSVNELLFTNSMINIGYWNEKFLNIIYYGQSVSEETPILFPNE